MSSPSEQPTSRLVGNPGFQRLKLNWGRAPLRAHSLGGSTFFFWPGGGGARGCVFEGYPFGVVLKSKQKEATNVLVSPILRQAQHG